MRIAACIICGKEFTPSRKDNVLCSKQCKKDRDKNLYLERMKNPDYVQCRRERSARDYKKNREKVLQRGRQKRNTYEYKEWYREYRQKPDVIERRRECRIERERKPEYRQRSKTYRNKPGYQEWLYNYNRSPQRIEGQRRFRKSKKFKQWVEEYRKNPENKKKANSYASNRRARQRNLPNTLTHEQWQHALNYFNGCCAVCGRQLNDLFGSHKAAQDHWIPIAYQDNSNPGTVATNIIPLCHGENGCNNSKHDTMPSVWLRRKHSEWEARKIEQRIRVYFDSLK